MQERTVFFRPQKLRTDEERQAARRELEELKEQVRKIHVESELMRDMEHARRRAQVREVDVDVE